MDPHPVPNPLSGGEEGKERVSSSPSPQQLSSDPKPAEVVNVSRVDGGDGASIRSQWTDITDGGRSTKVPRRIKFVAVLLVSAIGFAAHWSTGLNSAMKSTLKKELNINNSQFAVLEASEDFIKVTLILATGVLTDRFGGVDAMLYGNIVYFLGSILVASGATVKSYNLMIGGTIITALGDIATQVAQYKVFCSWLPPSDGFASTLGLELGIGKIGSFVGKATANVIADRTGNFAWVYWVSVFINLFTIIISLLFWIFKKWCLKQFSGTRDPATGEKLSDNNRRFELQKMLQLPWIFWGFVAFTLFQTSTATIFSQNSTELAEQRFNVSAIKAGWYSAISQYLGFFLVPVLGIFIDVFGNRLTLLCVCGSGMLLSMCLCAWGPSVSGTAASFGIYAVAYLLGPTTIIDGIRTSIWYQEVFGSAYGIKIAVNNAMNIIVRIVTGVIQDHDNDSYDHVVVVYVILAAGSLVVSWALMIGSFFSIDLRRLQWTRKERIIKGDVINSQKEKFESGKTGERNRVISLSCFSFVLALILGSWVAYFWGVATGHND
ncbi:major facilitator superfamily domain-containing protein [Phyllosticta capitalensis]|uniref:major facilitator superfamily domain-containing protein n=1 Tax=Phyllosticta capitalensis TaxID=121624 RepID=UPI00312D7F4E